MDKARDWLRERARRKAEATQEFKGYKVSELREIFEIIQNDDDWKAPWAASVPHHIVDIVCKAVEFFHADKVRVVGIQRMTGMVVIEGRGYQG